MNFVPVSNSFLKKHGRLVRFGLVLCATLQAKLTSCAPGDGAWDHSAVNKGVGFSWLSYIVVILSIMVNYLGSNLSFSLIISNHPEQL